MIPTMQSVLITCFCPSFRFIYKNNYYAYKLESNRNDLKPTWREIKDILGKNKKNYFPEEFINGLNEMSNSKEIADCFNTYFTNIGSTLASKITPTEKHFTDYLHNSNSSSFFL